MLQKNQRKWSRSASIEFENKEIVGIYPQYQLWQWNDASEIQIALDQSMNGK